MHTQKTIPFQSRTDLTPQKRFLLAYIVSYQNTWGTVSRLARKNNVSRRFIYNTVAEYSPYFEKREVKSLIPDKTSSLKFILSHRMEGKCSIPSISILMQRQNLPYYSVGSISEMLSDVSKKVGSKLNIEHQGSITFAICCDELFIGQRPILITIDPISWLILKIELGDNRKHDTWKKHWQEIKAQDIQLSKLINDEGVGMKLAQEIELSDIERQSDTFHAVAHRLGLYVNRLLSKAYKAIDYEYERLRLSENSKTPKTNKKRKKQYKQSKVASAKSINDYEDFTFLYHCLLDCFQVFDNNGCLKDIQKVKADFDTALEYLKQLNCEAINEEVKSIENCRADLFTFYLWAEKNIAKLSETIDNDILNQFCLAWQCRKNSIKAKDVDRKNKFKRREQYILNDVKELIDNEYEKTKNRIYEQLNQIIQSSAAVEGINSVLRPYLNTSKNHVTQEFLNLFKFYHNHRRFKNGERKGKTPMEIATNSNQNSDWLDLLLRKTEMN